MLSKAELEKNIYIQVLLNENKWFSQAIDLEETAALLEEKVEAMWSALSEYSKTGNSSAVVRDNCSYTYLMLMAFSIENYLKGVLVRDRKHELKSILLDKAILPKTLKSHCLYTLATEIGIPNVESHEGLLRRLSRSAIWRGRYPVPLHSSSLYDQKYSDGSVFNIAHLQKDDTEQVRDLLNYIKEKCNITSRS